MSSDKSQSPREVSAEALAASQTCLQHAEDLVEGAEILLEAGHAYVSFHLAVLSLEETGKAFLVRLQDLEAQAGDEGEARRGRRLNDHVKKIYWAIWGLSFGREVLTRQRIEEYQGVAKRIHARRQEGIYFSTTADGQRPRDLIPEKEAAGMIQLARHRLDAEKRFEPREYDPERDEPLLWFLDATDDEEKSRFIFGPESMEKLVALGVPQWIGWLRERIEKDDAEREALLQRELNRGPPEGDEGRVDKWEMRLRFFSESHSIRRAPLQEWNRAIRWLQFTYAKSDELIVDVRMTTHVAAEALWEAGLQMREGVLLALNIGTTGLFWWDKPKLRARYYEKLTDLESGRELTVEKRPDRDVEWGRQVLDRMALGNVKAAFLGVLHSEGALREALEPYGRGLTCFAKTDTAANFSGLAFREFFETLVRVLRAGGDWDGEQSLRDAVLVLGDGVPDRVQGLVELGENLRRGERPDYQLGLGDVAMLKMLVDLLLLRQFRRLLKDWATRERGEDSGINPH